MSESHADRLEKELEALRELFVDSRNAEDNARVIQLAKVIASMETAIEKMRLREGTYVTKDALDEFMDGEVARFIEISKKYIPQEAWEKIVDELIGMNDA